MSLPTTIDGPCFQAALSATDPRAIVFTGRPRVTIGIREEIVLYSNTTAGLSGAELESFYDALWALGHPRGLARIIACARPGDPNETFIVRP